MSFFGGGGNKKPDAAAAADVNASGGAAIDPDSLKRTKYAAPPPCPRCELTRNQMQRTVHNYQKAYRKKVEGLKVELGSARGDAALLRERVRRLQRRRLLHTPALVLGAALGWLAARHGKRVLEAARDKWERMTKRGGGKGGGDGGGGGDEAGAATAAAS
jgi:hypothetical protein